MIMEVLSKKSENYPLEKNNNNNNKGGSRGYTGGPRHKENNTRLPMFFVFIWRHFRDYITFNRVYIAA